MSFHLPCPGASNESAINFDVEDQYDIYEEDFDQEDDEGREKVAVSGWGIVSQPTLLCFYYWPSLLSQAN